ncbi:putative receptor-like protein kinase [Morus notabilis]|uniref:Putative receptor-like protein kinase n=1 Tax=Morus notabilis TaxID=981085 RepID=W9S0C4_9ROSA|nr:putative receptor-like protein kinase [Morus notabilis]
MEKKKKKKKIIMNLHSLSLLSTFSLLLNSIVEASFTPSDNYLLNCGSPSNATLFNRVFLGDSSKPGSAFLSSDPSSVQLKNRNPPPNSSALYSTARVFKTASLYTFRIRKNGTHIVRFHFSPFVAPDFSLKSANFTVSVDGNLVLRNVFNVRDSDILVREYILKVNKDKLEILFTPVGDPGFAYVNGIEVFSAPDDFIVDYGAKFVSSEGVEEHKNLSSQVFETVHRINVGGSKLTPFNDTLWRTWLPDKEYLVLESSAKPAISTDIPNYQEGGASREIAPDNVYMTAQEMNKTNFILDARFNVTWKFPVGSGGVRHLVRLHFCDIVSPGLNLLYFNVYINSYYAYRDLDLSVLTVHVLASPIYIDFIVDSDDSGFMQISVGPSDLSPPSRINAILNGAEIMRMVNVDGSRPGDGGDNKKTVWILVGSIVGGVVLLCLAVIGILCCLRRKKRKPKRRPAESVGWTPLRVFGGSSLSRMSERTTLASPNGYLGLRIPFADILLATNNFDKSRIIGSGGFGIVYKGALRDNTKVAVKRGMPGSRQGLPEFQAEITVLSKIRHLHLVSLVGYCEEQAEMILVYEYMEKGTLRNHFKRRSAQGIIHRDIKSTNILLDETYVAKVADFGLSRSGPCLNETHVSTGVKGSFGYLDPEYFRRQQLTDKSDVYSFGVVLLEVLCARPAVDPLLAREQVNLAEWALQWQKKGMLERIIDRRLVGQIKPSSLKKFGETAEKCLAEYGVDRPTMGDVLWNLEHALQLQEAEPRSREREEDANADSHELLPSTRTDHESPHSNTRTEETNGNGSLEINSSQVFSQLLTNDGR